MNMIIVYRISLLVVSLYIDKAISFVTKSVKYNISSSGDIVCAASTTDERYIGVRIQDGTHTCEGLGFDWIMDPVHQPGYKYVLKMRTLLMYTPPVSLNTDNTFGNIIQLLIPGLLTPGSKIELFLTKQTPWERLRVRITEKEEHHFDPAPNEIILYQLRITESSTGFNYYKNGWSGTTSVGQLFTDGVKQKLTILVTQEYFQTFIDADLMYNSSHVANPQTARLLWIHSQGMTNVTIHSLGITLKFPP